MSKWEEYKKKLGDTKPWDALNLASHIDGDIASKRMEICDACPRLIRVTKQCKECGCFMVIKTKLKDASCPIGKW